ncbi:hypothetical protein JMA_12820 [Jeotgalibacillus malaysiensis]|uniref:Multidrug ABC transporter ATPase n=1 Tax=Jeotgalibacillus malaysiensis TaxID=1508404 RepID=A0A0B5AR85_9BACL|nr:hypothetical protein [Jeotgalibacillus malaysiensis]AJD90599.1 hypothetical protein JMA_12820 [Jeotgalibacillus malaysiensis]
MTKKHEYDKNDVPDNSSMASDLEEMDQLGRQMEKMRTNEQLRKHREPGTEQYEEEE